MSTPKAWVSMWLCAALAACATSGAVPEPEATRPPPPEPRPSQLYARDGTPVGATAAQAGPMDSRGGENGRMYILELYQRAVEEREALSLQVDALHAEGDKLRKALAASERTLAAHAAADVAHEAERRRLVDENVELAGRLVTAQIRRLQAEKMLLEHRLAQQAAAAAMAHEGAQPGVDPAASESAQHSSAGAAAENVAPATAQAAGGEARRP